MSTPAVTRATPRRAPVAFRKSLYRQCSFVDAAEYPTDDDLRDRSKRLDAVQQRAYRHLLRLLAPWARFYGLPVMDLSAEDFLRYSDRRFKRNARLVEAAHHARRAAEAVADGRLR